MVPAHTQWPCSGKKLNPDWSKQAPDCRQPMCGSLGYHLTGAALPMRGHGGVQSQSTWLPPESRLWIRDGLGQLVGRKDWNGDPHSSVRALGCKHQALTLPDKAEKKFLKSTLGYTL